MIDTSEEDLEKIQEDFSRCDSDVAPRDGRAFRLGDFGCGTEASQECDATATALAGHEKGRPVQSTERPFVSRACLELHDLCNRVPEVLDLRENRVFQSRSIADERVR